MQRTGAIVFVAALGAGACCWHAAPRDRSAQRDELVEIAGQLARSVASCGDKGKGRLPPSARAVPTGIGEVAGGKPWTSRPEDWGDEAYKCGPFILTGPQRWQVQWVTTGPRQGLARVSADLDGDAVAELVAEHDVSCSGDRCMAAPYVREPVPARDRDGGSD